MAAIAPQGHASSVNCLNSGNRIAFDAGDLNKPANGIAGQSQRMLHGDLSSVLHLLRGAAQSLSKPRSRHCRGRTDLPLTANLSAGNRRVCLDQSANRSCGQQELMNRCATATG